MLSRDDRIKRLKANPITVPTSINKKVSIYAYSRCSSTKQKEYGYSIQAQVESILQKCKNEKLLLTDHFSDEGVSGRKMDRPSFDGMLSRLKPGDVIIAYSLSRLARNTRKFLKFVSKMKEQQIRIICIKEGLDIVYDENGELSADAKAKISMYSLFAEWEADKIKEQTRDGMDQSKDENGKVRTRPPFGYKVIYKPDGSSEQVEDEEQQKVIQFVLQCIINDRQMTVAAITRLVNNQITLGNLVYKGKKSVQHCQISAIIQRNRLKDDDKLECK
jgi:DNA invertase Pin-like site-specific DNA recombinase